VWIYGSGRIDIKDATHTLKLEVNSDIVIDSTDNTGLASLAILIGSKTATGNFKGEHIKIDDVNQRFTINMTNILLAQGTASKYYGTDVNNYLVPMTDPDTFWKRTGTIISPRVVNDTLNIVTNTELPTLSAEMNTSPATWTIGANWTNNGDGSYTAAASSGLLSTTISATSGRRYLIAWTGLSYLATITLGAVTLSKPAQTAVGIADITAGATGTLTLSFQFGSSNTGTISAISIKELTPITSRVPAQYLHTTSTGIGMEIRSNLIGHSVGMGLNSLGYLNTNGSGYGLYNTSFGELSCANLTSANYATAMGYMSLNSLTTGEFNTAFGYRAGQSLTVGNNNVFIGYDAGRLAVTAIRTVAIGSNAGSSLTTGSCVFVGFQSGNKCTTGTNLGIGDQALSQITTNGNNTVVGTTAMINGTGQGNSIFGASAGIQLSTGQYNHFFGFNAGSNLSTGSYNLMFGTYTGSTGAFETVRLQQTLPFSSDANNILIGYAASKQKLGSVVDNSIAIGNYSRFYANNQVVLGNTETTSTYLRGDIEIRNHQVLAANSLSESNFATHALWTETGDVVYNVNKFTYTHNTGIGSLEQTTANFATPIKPNTWYKVSVVLIYVTSSGGPAS